MYIFFSLLNNQKIEKNRYFDEADLLKEIINLKIKPKIFKKIQFQFLKTLNNPAKIFGKSGRQNEIGRDIGRYCWSTSQKDDVEYIDLDGNIFRCTYTVGRDEWKIGTLERYNNLLEKGLDTIGIPQIKKICRELSNV